MLHATEVNMGQSDGHKQHRIHLGQDDGQACQSINRQARSVCTMHALVHMPKRSSSLGGAVHQTTPLVGSNEP
jgi:hypothetical protein